MQKYRKTKLAMHDVMKQKKCFTITKEGFSLVIIRIVVFP